jgi:hypothetical protein
MATRREGQVADIVVLILGRWCIGLNYPYVLYLLMYFTPVVFPQLVRGWDEDESGAVGLQWSLFDY